MLRNVTGRHVVLGSKKNMHPLKGFIHLGNSDRSVYYSLRDVDNGGGVNYMFFSLLTKIYLDFGVEIVVILGIAAEDEKHLVGIVGVGRMGK